jgi:hypothetical protein
VQASLQYSRRERFCFLSEPKSSSSVAGPHLRILHHRAERKPGTQTRLYLEVLSELFAALIVLELEE